MSDGKLQNPDFCIPINSNSLESTTILSIELENELYIPFTDLQRNIRCLVHPQRRDIVESYLNIMIPGDLLLKKIKAVNVVIVFEEKDGATVGDRI